MAEEKIKFLKLHDDAIIPTRETEYSVGFDLYALNDTMIVGGGGNFLVSTGIEVQLPKGTYGRIEIISGLSVEEHLCVSGGVIDIDYIDNLGVVIFCTKVFDILKVSTLDISFDNCDYNSQYGMRIGQYFIEYNDYKCSNASTLMNSYVNDLMPLMTPHCYMIKKGEKFARLILEKVY